jgi:hypothetical protein
VAGWFIGTTSGSGLTYPFSYFNISTDKKDVGFVQVFACSVEESTIYFSVRKKLVDFVDVVYRR